MHSRLNASHEFSYIKIFVAAICLCVLFPGSAYTEEQAKIQKSQSQKSEADKERDEIINGAQDASSDALAGFPAWLKELCREARDMGISEKTLDEALKSVTPIARVIELDRKQPEKTISFARYRNSILSEWRIKKGRAMLREHKDLLQKVSSHYGVAPQYLVALWGIETGYGNYTGGFDVVSALATLAFDARRSAFFRKELLIALQIIEQGHISAKEMRGSWAGAMGQNQFMPSSFKNFAVDFDGDGRTNIWDSHADIFASSANYLSKSGWREGERWGREVQIPRHLQDNLISGDVRKSLEEWANAGVTLPGGKSLPQAQGFEASLVAPDGRDGPVYLVYNNYRTILKWNRSDYFATSVGLLADRISTALASNP